MTKATTAEGDELRYSPNWVVSRRAILKVMDDSLVCGNWTIPYSELKGAILYRVWATYMPCYILKVTTGEKSYQFGLNPRKFWKGELPFEVKREKAKLQYSNFSIVLRGMALIFIIKGIFEAIKK
jgi:hypothetical protein